MRGTGHALTSHAIKQDFGCEVAHSAESAMSQPEPIPEEDRTHKFHALGLQLVGALGVRSLEKMEHNSNGKEHSGCKHCANCPDGTAMRRCG